MKPTLGDGRAVNIHTVPGCTHAVSLRKGLFAGGGSGHEGTFLTVTSF